MEDLPDMAGSDEETKNHPTPPNPIKEMPSEFAEKPPLIYPQTMRKIIRIGLTVIGLLVILISGIYTARSIWKQQTTPLPEVGEAIAPEPEVIEERLPQFAYVRDGKSIWTANIKGEDKTKHLEMPKETDQLVTALAWKEKDLLSYAMCNTTCEILSYNTINKSVTPEFRVNGQQIRKFSWGENSNYLAFVSVEDGQAMLNLQTGTVNSILKTFQTETDQTNSRTRVFFTDNGQYAIYSTIKKDIIPATRRGEQDVEIVTPMIFVYQLNGSQVDEISNASDAFLINDTTLGYMKDSMLKYRTIGVGDETDITQFQGFNPEISSDKNNIIYWRNEATDRVILGVFESNRGIHRNILRGMILPKWISEDKVVAIKADSCLGETCLLYQFQTASLVIVDINKGDVISVDQSKSISEVVFDNANPGN